MDHVLTNEKLWEFERSLREAEYESATIKKYLRELYSFRDWLEDRAVNKEGAAAFKSYLQEAGYAPSTVNTKISALNVFFQFAGWEECKVKFLRIQKQIFRSRSKELSRDEYFRLLNAARAKGKEKLALLMEAICCIGIRVSEVSYITVEAVEQGRAEISLKGKTRVIFFPKNYAGSLKAMRKSKGLHPEKSSSQAAGGRFQEGRFGER